jgi:hypothetical protein
VSFKEDPQKLLEELADFGSDRELRLGLRGLASRMPSGGQLARIAAAVELELAAPEAATNTDAGAAASVKPALVAAGGIVAAGGLLLAVWALQTPNTTRQEKGDLARITASAASSTSSVAKAPHRPENALGAGSPRASANHPESRALGASPDRSGDRVQPLVSAAPVPGPAAMPEATDAAPQQPAAPRPPAKTSTRSTRAAAPPEPPPAIGLTETQILRDARLVLDRDPRSALALSEQHRRDYRNGSFAQEREFIAITALVKLGRNSEAKERAARFVTAYPSSPYRARLERLLP